jgi:hypothetical protein
VQVFAQLAHAAVQVPDLEQAADPEDERDEQADEQAAEKGVGDNA